MLLIDKLKIFTLSFVEKVNHYKKILKDLDLVKSSINDILTNYLSFKRDIDEELVTLEKGDQDFFLRKKLEEKYNLYFSDYLIKIGDFKKSFDSLNQEKKFLLKNRMISQVVDNFEKAELLEQTRNFIYKKYLIDCLGLKRRELPQLDYKSLQRLIPKLKESNITIQELEVPLTQLKPTQGEFNEDKILDMISDFNKPVFTYIVSQDGYMVDGHHTWASELEKNENAVGDVIMIGLSIQDLLDFFNKLEVFKKLDLQDEEIQKAIITLVKAYELGKISKQSYDRVNNYLVQSNKTKILVTN